MCHGTGELSLQLLLSLASLKWVRWKTTRLFPSKKRREDYLPLSSLDSPNSFRDQTGSRSQTSQGDWSPVNVVIRSQAGSELIRSSRACSLVSRQVGSTHSDGLAIAPAL
ncbi:hypothetical protein X777_02343 [Ooceraea biroi]|uniref:Uncharacterized protein n=1 Tax=Ooceraea biroi TaxID=2015173 RepID=A0A026WLB7_OOCBI|nr:hypothetical protein X777_02343 [Ooceraea biroi]